MKIASVRQIFPPAVILSEVLLTRSCDGRTGSQCEENEAERISGGKTQVFLSFLKQQDQHKCRYHRNNTQCRDHAAEAAAAVGSSAPSVHRRATVRMMVVMVMTAHMRVAMKTTGTAVKSSVASTVETSVTASMKSSRTWHKNAPPFLFEYTTKISRIKAFFAEFTLIFYAVYIAYNESSTVFRKRK